eukprot:CAMPEP_0178379778 /NCGR_PEP_ID=MMETSP0689_2-20121128/5121_1 /TAXON_ID=160604 /ORGANISM="Amphidinium massartii, Strain CS-259" /LENGTH=369 /DNA_ID=CAMNT_0019999897 /DNA_START=48 /DNA_END=1157 /DNA_ORIENTATION=-
MTEVAQRRPSIEFQTPPGTARRPSSQARDTPTPPPHVNKSMLQIDERHYRWPITPPPDEPMDRLRARSQTPMSSARAATMPAPRTQSACSTGRPHGMTPDLPPRPATALGPAFDLRQYSLDRKRLLGVQRPKSARVESLACPLEYIDLLGGNGRWRQRKAILEWERRQAEEEEMRAQWRIEEEARRKRKVELEMRKKKQAEEEERRRQEERDRQKREAEEAERRRFEEEERKRLLREQQEREWLARQPKTCDRCGGTGQCIKCRGTGNNSALFLVSRVTNETLLQFGRPTQGCDECGGRRQGILGELIKGSGSCYACAGTGKIAAKTETTGVMRRLGAPTFAQAPPLLGQEIGIQPPSIPVPHGVHVSE